MSMAARSSDLDKQKPGTNIQKEGHTLTPPSIQNGPEDPEAVGLHSTTSITCMAGTNCGRHGVRWQSWPNRSCGDRQQSLGEGLSLGKAQDTAFTLLGTVTWVGKPAQLSAKLASLGDGWELIAQAITEGHIKPRGPGHPHSIPPASTPFNFHNQDWSPQPANIPVVAE